MALIKPNTSVKMDFILRVETTPTRIPTAPSSRSGIHPKWSNAFVRNRKNLRPNEQAGSLKSFSLKGRQFVGFERSYLP
jgi:hypothetical protein